MAKIYNQSIQCQRRILGKKIGIYILRLFLTPRRQ